MSLNKIRLNYFHVSMSVVLVLAFVFTAFAQETGDIKGVVNDREGEPLPQVNIVLQGTTMGAATDMDGAFVINNVPPGDYTITAMYIGYKKKSAEITVSAGETTRTDFVLTSDVLSMEGMVVTGTAGGAGVTKREASFAITTIDAPELVRLSPSSTANMLETVPGVWSESSGGVAGANIFVRGMPASGDAPFVTMAINGAPLYGTETLSFFEQSSIFRIDETVDWVESQRGGPSSVFSNAEPGMTVNFNLKKGGEVTKGRLKYSTSDYNLQRLDAVLSGPITNGFYYMAGGYVRTAPGIRSTQFNAENGGQFTLQLTKTFDNGALNAFTRLTNDYGQWVLPMALNTGNDAGTFAQLGNATRFRELQINDNGDTRVFDFGKGRGWKGVVSGLNASFDLGDGWMVRDNLAYTTGDANTYGFVPQGNPVKVSDFLSVHGDSIARVQTAGNVILSGNDYIQNYGHWVVLKNLQSINNDLSLSKRISAHELTFGVYQARWASDDFWTLGNQVPVQNTDNGDLLKSSITAEQVAAAGGGAPWAYGIQSAGDARVFAAYGADSWQITAPLRIDVGIRHEWFDMQYTLDAGPGYPNGTTDQARSLYGRDFAFTGAVNYDLSPELGIFGRYSDGFLFPHFDNVREDNYTVEDGLLSTNDFKQGEVGIKYDTPLFAFFVTGFLNRVDVFDSDVGSVRDPARLQTQTMGAEIDGAFTYEKFNIKAAATYQNGEIKDASAGAQDVIGNSIWRQPDWQIRLSPSYDVNIGGFNAMLYGAVRSVGKRWDSRGNVFQLNGYTKLDLGIIVNAPGGMSFNVHGDNLTDSDGLTEGDPRDPSTANGRPIFGRSVKFAVGYDF